MAEKRGGDGRGFDAAAVACFASIAEMFYLLKGSQRKAGARRADSHRGVTIVEVLIAATLLSFVILGALAAISRGMTLSNHARMITLSSQVLQSAIEDLRLKNYSVIGGYAAASQPVDFTSTITSELLSSSFTRTMTLQAQFTTLQASTATQLGLIGVEVTVTWQEGTVPFSRSSRTYFSEKGLSDYIYVGF